MSLETVLRELSVPARDLLLKELRRHSDVYKVRLVCKAFRDFIDGVLQVFKLAPSPTHQELLSAGQPPPDLSRCRELLICMRAWPEWNTATYAAVLRLCVRSFPAQLRDRITTLKVDYIEKKIPGPHVALAGALSCLPALTHVHLSRISCAKDEPLQLELLYDTLTTLPCLESLSVPDLGVVRHLVKSGHNRSLKRLASRGTKGLSPDVCKNLASFEQLRDLDISSFTDVPGALVAQLLDNLPPRLEELRLYPCNLTLSSGFITNVRFDESYDSDLNEMLRSLLHCPAMPPRLARLAFEDLYVAADLPSDSPLAEILRRSDEVKVECMVLEPGATASAIESFLRPMRGWPRTFKFSLSDECDYLYDLYVPWHGAPFTAAGSSTPAPPAGAPSSLHPPSPSAAAAARPGLPPRKAAEAEDRLGKSSLNDGLRTETDLEADLEAESKAIISGTLERFVAAGHPLKYTGPIQKARQKGNTSDGGCGVLDDALTPALILSGPHVAALAPNPSNLNEWMRGLWEQTTQRFTGGFMWMVCTFVALPEQGAVLVCFFGPEVLAGFAKVVIAAAAKMRAAGSQAPAVQVTQVPIPRGESRHQDHISGVCGYIFNQLVERLWAEVCDSPAEHPSCGGGVASDGSSSGTSDGGGGGCSSGGGASEGVQPSSGGSGGTSDGVQPGSSGSSGASEGVQPSSGGSGGTSDGVQPGSGGSSRTSDGVQPSSGGTSDGSGSGVIDARRVTARLSLLVRVGEQFVEIIKRIVHLHHAFG